MKNISFSGKCDKKEYWNFILFSILLGFLFFGALIFILIVLMGSIGMNSEGGVGGSFLLGILLYIVAIVVGLWNAIAGIAVSIRRLHDAGMSGWWYLLLIWLGLIGTVIIGVMETDPNSEY